MKKTTQQEILELALKRLRETLVNVKAGKAPPDITDLKTVYQKLVDLEGKTAKSEITAEEADQAMVEQLKKVKGE